LVSSVPERFAERAAFPFGHGFAGCAEQGDDVTAVVRDVPVMVRATELGILTRRDRARAIRTFTA
jgi:hypothetical protein